MEAQQAQMAQQQMMGQQAMADMATRAAPEMAKAAAAQQE